MLFGLPPGMGERIGRSMMEKAGVEGSQAEAIAENPEWLAVAVLAVYSGVILAYASKVAGEHLGPFLGDTIMEEIV